MADIVNSLFGIDPAAYAQEQLAAQTNYNKALATMDPLQAGKFAMMQGASQLGNVGQSLLGIQDPMMQQATELKTIARGFDLTTADGLMQYAQAIQGKYPQYAQMAVAQANKLKESAATVHAKMKEQLSPVAKAQNDRLRLLQAGYSPNSVEVQELTKYINAEGSSKAPQLSVNAKMLDFGEGRRKAFFEENKDIIAQGRQLQQSLTLLEKADASPFAQGVFENKIANAFGGDKQVSRKEAERLANTGSFPTRVENSLRKFASGTISDLTREDQKNVLEAVQGDLKRAYEDRRSTVIAASATVPELAGQENYYAPTWQSTVGGGAAAGKKAYSVGQTLNTKDYGILKVTKVDANGNILEAVDSKGNVGTPNK